MGGKRQRRFQGSKIARADQKLTEEQLVIAISEFYSLKTPEELCKLLDVSLDSLLSVFFSKYSSFTIHKNGKEREILHPDFLLLEIQTRLSYYLNCIYVNQIYFRNIHNSYAYIPSLKEITEKNKVKNIVSNASNHVNKQIVANIDLIDFFNSIPKSKIVDLFENEPFNFSSDLINFIAEIVTKNGVLPVGAATSPILSNFIMLDIDEQLNKIPNVKYTRFSDDLTFSTDFYSFSEFENILTFVTDTIEKSGFRINESKKTIKKNSQKQIVTGIIVNKKTNVDRRYVRNIRAVLHSVTTVGWSTTYEKYAKINEKKFLRAIRRFWYAKNLLASDDILLTYTKFSKQWYFHKSFRAKIEHIGYIKGKDDEIYRRLLFDYLNLTKINQGNDKIVPNLELNDDIVFVTNATADSIVFYAYSFLINSGLNDQEITDLRNKFCIYGSNRLAYDEIKRNFQNQSAYFMNLYTYMTSFDRFEKFLNEIESQAKFRKVFKSYESPSVLLRHFNRKVYHTNHECKNIRNDYIEKSKYFENTGIFFDEGKEITQKFYVLKRSFLDFLKMRKCKKC